MYAVIESGGKQYRVTVGDRLKVESLQLAPGSKLSLDKVLLVADQGDVKIGGPYLGSKVEATVVGHGRGEKIRIFKLRRRKNSRQRAGHRQNYTELEIISIDGKSGDRPKKTAETRKDEEPQAASERHGGEEAVTKQEAAKAAAAETAAENKAAEKQATTAEKEQD